MLKTMLALAKMQFKDFNIYKSNFYLFTLNRIVEVIVYIFVWQAIYNQAGNAGGFSLSQMVTYYILAISFSSIATWGINSMMAHSIRNGQINKELLNPISYFKYYFGINLGQIAFAVVIGVATFIICSIFWKLTLPANFVDFILCILVILLGIPITFFIQMIVGTTGFYTNSIWGMQILRKAIIQIFSGIIAPISLFPLWFQKLSIFLPFKELIYTPINIWLGQVSYNEIIFIIIKQILWGIILYITARLFFNHSVKQLTINGG
jgi:ABC-2 type transport system permease protein